MKKKRQIVTAIALLLSMSLCTNVFANTEQTIANNDLNSSLNIKEYYKIDGLVALNENTSSILISEYAGVELYETDKFIIKYSDSAVLSLLEESYTVEEALSSKNAVSIKTESKLSFQDFKKELRTLNLAEYITYIQPDYSMQLSTDGEIKALETELQTENTTVANQETVQTEKIIAVLDTWVDTSHEGISDIIYGNNVDFTKSSEDPYLAETINAEWHGTYVTSLIKAGMSGAINAKVMPLTVFYGGKGYTSDIIQAIEYAQLNGASMVNMSFESNFNNPILEESIRQSNMTFVTASGNGGRDLGMYPSYPASIDSINVVAVASCDETGTLSVFSNYGSAINYTALGESVNGAFTQNKYATSTGTSASSAYICGKLSTEAEISASAAVNMDLFMPADESAYISIESQNGTELNVEQSSTVDENAVSPFMVEPVQLSKKSYDVSAPYADFNLTQSHVVPDQYGGMYLIGKTKMEIFRFDSVSLTWETIPSNISLKESSAVGCTNGEFFYISGNTLQSVRLLEDNTWGSTRVFGTLPPALASQGVHKIIRSEGQILLEGSSNAWVCGYASKVFSILSNTTYGNIVSVDIGISDSVGEGIYTSSSTSVYRLNNSSLSWDLVPITFEHQSSGGVGDPYVINGMELASDVEYLYLLGGQKEQYNATTGQYENVPQNDIRMCVKKTDGTFDWKSAGYMCDPRLHPLSSGFGKYLVLIIGGMTPIYNDGSIAKWGEFIEYGAIDDHWNTFATATQMANSTSISGAINYTGDQDVFKFDATSSKYFIEIFGFVTVDIYSDTYELLGSETFAEGPGEGIQLDVNPNSKTYVVVTGSGTYSDFKVVPTANLIGDDFGNTYKTSTLLVRSNFLNGIIKNTSDLDYFKIVPSNGDRVKVTSDKTVTITIYTSNETQVFTTTLIQGEWESTYNFSAGATYYVKLSSSSTPAYTIQYGALSGNVFNLSSVQNQNLYLSIIDNIETSAANTYTITYDPLKISIEDICTATYENETTASATILARDIVILAVESGFIKFSATSSENAYKVINTLKFKGLATGQTTVTISKLS